MAHRIVTFHEVDLDDGTWAPASPYPGSDLARMETTGYVYVAIDDDARLTITPAHGGSDLTLRYPKGTKVFVQGSTIHVPPV